MQKPIKPPRPNSTPPSRIKEIQTVVTKLGDDFDLVLKKDDGRVDIYTGVFDKKLFNFIQNSIDQIGLSNVIDDFKILVTEYGVIYVYLYCCQSEEFYKKELLEFENRFENYKTATLKYEKELKIYEEWSREQRILKLQQELDSINANKSQSIKM